jgi:hypothetical protein
MTTNVTSTGSDFIFTIRQPVVILAFGWERSGTEARPVISSYLHACSDWALLPQASASFLAAFDQRPVIASVPSLLAHAPPETFAFDRRPSAQAPQLVALCLVLSADHHRPATIDAAHFELGANQ